ncbi:NAD(P)/FAD-dependent oxidoreductase [Sphingobium sp. SCG-1]|uniref:NAD(P)/FAD-dependent oxidoreductase n=1 Tax=Sphingobium sp. SCG-1 TaxID=2072936 RepID=UPI001670041E|nr:FAD-binding oxidoreductase [Sphingobium sp. SCG-1]
MPKVSRREFSVGLAASLTGIPVHGAVRVPRRHVIIVGAGIMGASIASHLARRGAQVTILEKAGPAAGATQGSFAWINAYDKKPAGYYELNLAGVMGWRRVARELGSALTVQWGGSVQWFDAPDKAEALRTTVSERQRMGYPIRLITADEVRALLPGVETGPVAVASFAEIEATVDPLQATRALLADAQRLGARLISGCDVLSLESRDGRIDAVITNRGRMRADSYVLAAGGGMMDLARQVGIMAPIIEGSGVLAHSKPMPRLIDRVVLLPEFSIKQNPDGRIVAGAHFAGSRKLLPTREFGEQTLARAAHFLPMLKWAQLDFMTLGKPAMRTDGLPVAGSTVRYRNLFLAVMNSGVTLAPAIGQLAATEVLDGVLTDLLDPYRV